MRLEREDMNEKPIIRHWRNCKWHRGSLGIEECEVKYDYIHDGRIKALFCRYYKQKDSQTKL